ncbi:hypothetical protein EJ06DRAFT_246369 [Trichodelitschia bisporula]|uniref:HSF-type DNA-binding domain-containing protein n=1 Tax=Trichodelitschia bisporula TaxID=703511 RepID=A0A6G1HJC9_9PEZI|nr:hypothetical protein EJ06DRAFT_246369 [Trichodelitschia bisporula]
MASATESIQRNHFADHFGAGLHKSIPILPSSSGPTMQSVPEPMDITPSSAMGPPALTSPIAERTETGQLVPNGDTELAINGNGVPPVGAAAAAQQPKVVQTAFIHKLYNMLEDHSIRHLISWSNTNESFVMSPSTEFSKVLSSYFKHTNISSFVRQLNMYGFHKVSDVFHTSAPDSPLWEFKHGNGNFKRGDLNGLREIKRRASKHTLIHRDSFSAGPKPGPSQVGAAAEPMPDTVDNRLSMLEHHYYDMHARLARAEDHNNFLTGKCSLLTDGILRCHQWNQDLATYIVAMTEPESQIHKDVTMMRNEIARQTDMLRHLDEQPDTNSLRPPYFAGVQEGGPPLSPRQMPLNDQRRPSQLNLAPDSRPPFRPPMAPHLAISPRRYGSIGTGSNSYSPNSARTPAHAVPQPPPPPGPPPPHVQHPLATVSSPPMNLSRRHTSADIRLQGWQGGPPPPSLSPYASGHNSTQWPSSPHRAPLGGDQQLQEQLAQYKLPHGSAHGSRQPTPPAPPMGGDPQANAASEAGWQLPGARYPYSKGLDTPGPPTRRGSMASNVHSLLNPAGAGDEEEQGPEEKKRKRMQ